MNLRALPRCGSVHSLQRGQQVQRCNAGHGGASPMGLPGHCLTSVVTVPVGVVIACQHFVGRLSNGWQEGCASMRVSLLHVLRQAVRGCVQGRSNKVFVMRERGAFSCACSRRCLEGMQQCAVPCGMRILVWAEHQACCHVATLRCKRPCARNPPNMCWVCLGADQRPCRPCILINLARPART
jgi:hypothetical protein